ncbi:MAG TPA: SCP2 sterol-binding domain-containing protein [Blastocatellia bacterium]|nr:SCP2 sterol-binding domain-containing protein [Blastocatellia bacterium]HMX24451.1 SCP2 sterol-binding domain-containing protein [Blastocatellia bacterium]HMY76042.1 SCP2 sterol-binding domain-containing protein [Blastocatellia bacterium]HMZ21888.1 SCP2 sterol-binding domain-containing protein [Blastocatellia bacterium]HNM47383.1 SCP2 sterol-binding domain-containing protein [Candidatus Sumerlaeota bacterium]
MAVDIQKYFNEDLPAAMAKNPDAARAIGAKYQMNVSGSGGGEWFIDVSAGGPKCFAGFPGGADATITIATEDFQKLYEDPKSNTMPLFFAARLKVSGDPRLGLQISKIFDLTSPGY